MLLRDYFTVSAFNFDQIVSTDLSNIVTCSCNIIAVSDITGGLYAKSGLNIKELLEWRDRNNYLNGDYLGPFGFILNMNKKINTKFAIILLVGIAVIIAGIIIIWKGRRGRR